MFLAILMLGVVGLAAAFLAVRLMIREWSNAITADREDKESGL